MIDTLMHWVRSLQDANVPLVQLQDPTSARGTYSAWVAGA